MLDPTSTSIKATKKAVFHCVAKGYGNITVEWRKLGSHLPITAQVYNTISLCSVKSTLEIHKSIGYYKGGYYCSANNDGGVVNSSVALLNVSGIYIRLMCRHF